MPPEGGAEEASEIDGSTPASTPAPSPPASSPIDEDRDTRQTPISEGGKDTPKAKLDKGQKTFKETKGTKSQVFQTGPGQPGQQAEEVMLAEAEEDHQAQSSSSKKKKSESSKVGEKPKGKSDKLHGPGSKQKTKAGEKKGKESKPGEGADVEGKTPKMTEGGETEGEESVQGGSTRRGRKRRFGSAPGKPKDKGEKMGEKQGKTTARRAGCIFPVARIHRFLKSYATAKMRVGGSAGIFTAAVMEYLAAEVLELAGNVCGDYHLKRITPRHLQIAIRSDEELAGFVKATIAGGGVIPNINQSLFPNIRLREDEAYKVKFTSKRQLHIDPGAEMTPRTDPGRSERGSRVPSVAGATPQTEDDEGFPGDPKKKGEKVQKNKKPGDKKKNKNAKTVPPAKY